MAKELYFDIHSENSGGSLYKITGEKGDLMHFNYNHSTFDEDRGDVQIFETNYTDFAAFWKALTKDPEWYYRHPLFVHPEQREFVRELLRNVNWNVHPDKKWQESHQRQWRKVLQDPGKYYDPQAS